MKFDMSKIVILGVLLQQVVAAKKMLRHDLTQDHN